MKQKYTSHLASDKAGGQSNGFDTLSANKQTVISMNVWGLFFFIILEQLRFTHRQHEDCSSGSWQTVSTGKAGTTRRTLRVLKGGGGEKNETHIMSNTQTGGRIRTMKHTLTLSPGSPALPGGPEEPGGPGRPCFTQDHIFKSDAGDATQTKAANRSAPITLSLAREKKKAVAHGKEECMMQYGDGLMTTKSFSFSFLFLFFRPLISPQLRRLSGCRSAGLHQG